MTNYERLGLYPHNVRASEEVKEAFENGEDTVSIVHATGTGKSYNALALAMDNKDQEIIWVVPTNAIKEHIEKTINDNSLLNSDDDFPNLEIITYSSLVNKTKDEIANIPCNLLIVDELHHLGAPVWGQRINDFIDMHEDLKVFGMTAYTVRDRGTIYERDMVNPETDEIFSDSVVSNFDLYDALIEGVLPKPVVRSVVTENAKIIEEIKENIETLKKKQDPVYKDYEQMLNDVYKIIHEQQGVKELVQQSVKPGGKYIYFCPLTKEEGVNDISSIQKKMMEYLQEKYPNKKIVFYSSTSKDGELGKKNRDCFYHDVDLEGNNCQDAIRIIFVINQYNEGVHAPNVDGVFLGRTTGSDIVAFEQIGRALSVRGDNYKEIEEYQKYSLGELRKLAISRGLPVEENHNKEQIIELLVSPLIIDLANNMEFIDELETNLGTRLKEAHQEQSEGKKRIIKISDAKLNMTVINHDLLNILKDMRERLRTMTWDDKFNLLKAYYNHHDHSNVPEDFKTINGYDYDENGITLGYWVQNQRQSYKNGKLSKGRIQKLSEVDFKYSIQEEKIEKQWDIKYKLLQIYYTHHSHSNVPKDFKTINGYEYNENGLALGSWVQRQRNSYKNGKLSKGRIQKLSEVDFKYSIQEEKFEKQWDIKYKLLQNYYNHHGHSSVPRNFKTINGYEYDENGIDLGQWVSDQRSAYNNFSLSTTRIQKLSEVDFIDDARDYKWNQMYQMLKKYYEHHGHSSVPSNFKTINGYEYDENGIDLGQWVIIQRSAYNNLSLSTTRIQKLSEVDFIYDARDYKWNQMYQMLKKYYEHHGHSNVMDEFKTINGYEYDENGITLGYWVQNQRQFYKNGKLSKGRIQKLNLLGFRFNTKKEHTNKVMELCNQHGLNYKKYKILSNIPYQELYAKIEFLLENNISLEINGELNPIFGMSNENMKVIHGVSKEELISKYYISNQNRGK